jgi:hypothetical protein
MKTIVKVLAFALLLATLNSQLSTVFAQGTVFTYQGRLDNNGAPVSGSYDLQFTLFATNITGAAIAGPLTNAATAVSNGLFTCAIDFGQGVFTGVAYWLDIAVRTNGGGAFKELIPRQPLTPAPYSVFADTASELISGLSIQQNTDGAPNVIGGSPVNFVAGGTVGATIGGGGATNFTGVVYSNSVNGSFGTVGGGFQNTTFGIGATVGGGYANAASGFYATVGGGMHNTASNTYATVVGGLENTAGAINATVGGGLQNIASGSYSFAAGRQAQALHQGAFVWADSQGGAFASATNDEFSIRAQGGVRISSGVGVHLNGASGTNTVTLFGNGSQISTYGSDGLERVRLWGPAYGEVLLKNSLAGNQTAVRLSANGSSGGALYLNDTNGNARAAMAGNNAGGSFSLYRSDGTATITMTADDGAGSGLITTSVLQITGGADLSEQFDIESAEGAIQPGMVVCIDPEHPGQLAVSTRAYDRTVAGIVSGAGGVNPGMLMGHQGTIADGKHPVALTGRVYCWADASTGPILPGDLLTTSARPGHAMKVTDPSRGQGAILGKAMASLEQGTGLVLVLVTLQ